MKNDIAEWVILLIVVSLFLYLQIYIFKNGEKIQQENLKAKILQEQCKKESYSNDNVRGFWENRYQYRRCIYNEKHR